MIATTYWATLAGVACLALTLLAGVALWVMAFEERVSEEGDGSLFVALLVIVCCAGAGAVELL